MHLYFAELAPLGVGEGRLRQVDVESLPSWVTFPSVDRVEWINILLEKVWARIGGMVQVRPPPRPSIVPSASASL